MSSILVVEDDEHVLEVVCEMLRMEGHDVSTAHDGVQAVDKVQRQPFDLVITDIIMPEKEGLETITDIRKSHTMPIIAISGGGRIGPKDYLETARHIGANATLAKPFGRKDLLDAVDSLLTA